MMFKELTDEQWERIRPLIPPPTRQGRPRADDRRTVNAIMYVLATGCRWTDLPGKFGDEAAAWGRLRAWDEEDVWVGLLDAIVEQEYSEEERRFGDFATDRIDVAAKKVESSWAMRVTYESRVVESPF